MRCDLSDLTAVVCGVTAGSPRTRQPLGAVYRDRSGIAVVRVHCWVKPNTANTQHACPWPLLLPWWYLRHSRWSCGILTHGYKTPLLKKVALMLLSLLATSSAVERSFSSLDYGHSKLRNMLPNLKREMLLYMCHNSRSLHKALIPVIGREMFRYTSKGSLVVSLPHMGEG